MERYEQISSMVLNILNTGQDSLSIVELAEQTKIHRNVLAKYLKVMEAQGKIEINKIGTKRSVSISNRIPSSFLREFTPHPFLIFDRFVHVIDGSEQASIYYPLSGEDSVREMDFKKTFLIPEIREKLSEAMKGKRSSHILDASWNGNTHSFSLTITPVVLENGRTGSALIIEDVSERHEERRLHESTRLAYNALLEDQIQYIVRFAPDYTITHANNVFVAHLGIDEESVIGYPFIPHFPEDTFHAISSGIGAIRSDNPVITLDIRRIVSGGDITFEHWRIRGLFDPPSGHLLGYHAVGMDISEFKKIEQELRVYKNNLESLISERTTELRQLNSELHKEIVQREIVERELILTKFAMDNADDLIFLLNPGGDIQYLNKKAREMTGETSKKNIRDIIGNAARKDSLSPFSSSLNEMISAGMVRIKGSLYRENGSDIPVEVTISRIVVRGEEIYCCIARDITERKKIERDLYTYRKHLDQIIDERTKRLQEEVDSKNRAEHLLNTCIERYDLMVDRSPEAIVLYDPNTGQVHDLNRKAEEIFGISGKNLTRIDPDPFVRTIRDYLLRMKNGTGEISVQITRTSPDIQYHLRMVKIISDNTCLIRVGLIEVLS